MLETVTRHRVHLCHNLRMLWTPAVFEAKNKSRLGYEAPANHSEEWVTNYKTAEEDLAAVKKKIAEDLREKRMVLLSYT